jgi:hypothetical protein
VCLRITFRSKRGVSDGLHTIRTLISGSISQQRQHQHRDIKYVIYSIQMSASAVPDSSGSDGTLRGYRWISDPVFRRPNAPVIGPLRSPATFCLYSLCRAGFQGSRGYRRRVRCCLYFRSRTPSTRIGREFAVALDECTPFRVRAVFRRWSPIVTDPPARRTRARSRFTDPR